MTTHGVKRVEQIRPPSHEQWTEIGTAQNDGFIKLLIDLNAEEWHRATDCDRWTVKDIACHILGIAEAFTSLRQLNHQFVRSLRRRKELGKQLDAMNQVGVDERRHLEPNEVVRRLEEVLPQFIRVRDRLGRAGRAIPMWDPNLGASSVRYLMDTIFARDAFMHRIDISRAASRPVSLTDLDRVLVADVIKDWARRARANVTVALPEPEGGRFIAGSGAIHITTDAIEVCRVLSGRQDAAAVSVEGDRDAAVAWLRVGCPF